MWSKFFYKINKDLLISLVITYFLLLIPELILPGIVSSHLDPQYVLIAIIMLGLALSWQGKAFPPRENIKFSAISRNILHIILFVAMVMLILSLYKMKLWQITVVSVFSLAIFVVAEKMLFWEKN